MMIGCGVVDRCTYHMPATTFQVPSRTISTLFSTAMCVTVNMAVQPSPHICPTEISEPDWRWGKVCDVLALVDKKGLRSSSALHMYQTRLPSGRSTCGSCVFLTLFSQGVYTLMYFCVAPMSVMTYIGLLVGGFSLQLLHSLVFFINYSDTLLLLLLIKRLFTL